MPRIWADTLDTHRKQVTDAILDATAALVAEHGPLSVAMGAVAERAGIGRATLYRYFPDVESIVVAWHERDVARHLGELAALAGRDGATLADVAGVVQSQRRKHTAADGGGVIAGVASGLAGFRHDRRSAVHGQVAGALAVLLGRLQAAGEVRDDLDPAVLAQWLLHAGHAPAAVDGDAVVRLVIGSLAPRRSRLAPEG